MNSDSAFILASSSFFVAFAIFFSILFSQDFYSTSADISAELPAVPADSIL